MPALRAPRRRDPRGAALAASTLTVGSTNNTTLGETVVVNPAGRTLYSLSGESSHHLLCRSRECAHFWPPLTVPSKATQLKAGAGVHGAFGLLQAAERLVAGDAAGQTAVPLLGDSGPDQAAGEGIHSFGGTWHAVTRVRRAAARPRRCPRRNGAGYGY